MMAEDKPLPGIILVVDDDPSALRFLAETLRAKGHAVRLAPTASLALTSFQAEAPDLVLLDVKLADMDGFMVAWQLRAMRPSVNVPVIFISGLTDTEDKVKGFEVGGVDFITKPFTADEVLARVATHLALSRSRALRAMNEQNACLQQEIEAEDALRAKAAESRLFYDLPFIGMATTSSETKRWLVVNDYLCQMLGYSKEELVQRTWVEMTLPDDLDADLEHFQQVMQGHSDGYVMDKRFIRKDGQIIDTVLNVQAIRRADGQVDRLVATLLDITERKRMESALQEELARNKIFSDIMDDIDAYVFIKDRQRRYVYANRLTLELLHCTAAELVGKGDEQFFTSDDALQQLTAVDNRVLEHGASTRVEMAVAPVSSGETRIYLEAKRPIYDGTGNIWGLSGIAADITEQKRIEDKLRESEQRLREITANLAEGLYVIDQERRINFINPTALVMLGWREEEVVGQLSHALFHHTYPDGAPYPCADCIMCDVLNQTTMVIDKEEFLWRRDGTCFPVSIVASPIFRSGEVRGAVVAFRDITQRKQNEEVLRQAMEQAEIAAQAKGNFLAAMSHEIRTPMNVVLGISGVLLETNLTLEQRQFVEMMHNSGGALLAIVNDVLDVSRIESGQFTLSDHPFSPMKTVDETTRIMQISAEQKDNTLIKEILPGVPLAILGDDSRVRQVLINLIGNAIKFTEHGQIKVSVQPHPQESDSILFTVADTGIGIASLNLERIFDRFSQADAGIARRYGGTGLGLTIARKLVELMGGRMWVESQLGQGSTFFFTLPARITELSMPQATHDGATTESTSRSLRILLAEDSEDNQKLFKIYLKKTPHYLVVVNDGLEAVARVQEEPFDLVLMDIQMPNMDGYAATRAIRQWEQEAGRSPMVILALSAHVTTGRKTESLTAGCDDYLTKPIKKQTLLEAIQNVGLAMRVN